MRPYFEAQPIPMLLFVCSVLVWLPFELRQALKRRANASSADRGSLLFLRLCVTLGVTAAVFADGRVPAAAMSNPAISFGVGIALLWPGIALRIWSFRTLGRYFTFAVMTSADQRVVDTGPYRFLRHPSYLGMLLALTGIGAMFGNWLSLAALFAIPLIGLANRIRVEEAALSTTLGDAYLHYASSRKRLLPRVW